MKKFQLGYLMIKVVKQPCYRTAEKIFDFSTGEAGITPFLKRSTNEYDHTRVGNVFCIKILLEYASVENSSYVFGITFEYGKVG